MAIAFCLKKSTEGYVYIKSKHIPKAILFKMTGENSLVITKCVYNPTVLFS